MTTPLRLRASERRHPKVRVPRSVFAVRFSLPSSVFYHKAISNLKFEISN